MMRSRAAQMVDNSRKWGREKEELLHKLHESEGLGYASRQVCDSHVNIVLLIEFATASPVGMRLPSPDE